jgi:hypothetical protein
VTSATGRTQWGWRVYWVRSDRATRTERRAARVQILGFGSIRISGRWLQCRLVMRRAYVWYARLSFAAFHPGALPAGSLCARGLEYASCSRCVDCAQGGPVGGVAAHWGRPTQMGDEACQLACSPPRATSIVQVRWVGWVRGAPLRRVGARSGGWPKFGRS